MTVMGILIFHEKMKCYHYVGVIFLISCAILISLSDDETKQKESNVEGHTLAKVSPIIAVLISIICPLIFSLENLIAWISFLKLWFETLDYSLVSYFWMNLYLIIASVVTDSTSGMTTTNILQAFLCGFLTLTALLFLNLAITQGYAGPVCALSAT